MWEFHIRGDRFQGLEVLKLCVGPDKFRDWGKYEQEFYPSPEVTGVAVGRALE